MQKFSRHILTLYYLGTQCNKPTATSTEIFNAQDDAANWYESQLPKSFAEDKNKILTANGFTPESWTDVLLQSGTFYFVPTEVMENTNKQIRELYNKYLIMNGSYYSWSTFSGALTTAYKNGRILRTNEKRNRYYLAIDIITKIKTSLNN